MASRVLIFCGEGKGKTTAALGAVLRALGHGFSVAVFQFIKGKTATGEARMLTQLGVELHRLGQGFTWRKDKKEDDRRLAQRGWQRAAAAIAGGEFDLVVLDEINLAIAHGFLDPAPVAEAIRSRPEHVHLILTGRGLDPQLARLADTVSEVTKLKHAFDQGVKATIGIEF